jgi:hypothetical protein
MPPGQSPPIPAAEKQQVTSSSLVASSIVASQPCIVASVPRPWPAKAARNPQEILELRLMPSGQESVTVGLNRWLDEAAVE